MEGLMSFFGGMYLGQLFVQLFVAIIPELFRGLGDRDFPRSPPRRSGLRDLEDPVRVGDDGRP